MDGFRIERVAYEDEYGSGEDLAAMLLAEALAGMGEGEVSGEGGGSAPTSEGSGSAPTPGPSREREGRSGHDLVPLPPAGGVGGGPSDVAPNRPPVRSGPEPLLTRPLQALFGEHLARHGNVRLACRAARVSAQTAYRMRRASASFRALWDAALVIARDQVEDVLADRAVHGWEEAVFYHGEEVARRRRYDSRLLLAHLARLDKLAERSAGGMVEQFDAVIDALAADEEPELAPAVAAEALRQAQDERGVAGVEAELRAGAVAPEAAPSAGEPPAGDEVEVVPLLEAQLRWLESLHGPMTPSQEVFHILHTVPGVPGAVFRAFGWRGSDAELAAANAQWQRRFGRGDAVGESGAADVPATEADQPCSSSMLTGAEPVRTMPICSAAACDRSSTRPRA